MKILNLKSTGIILTIGFLIGLSLTFLFSGNCNGPELNPALTISPAEQKQQIERSEKEHQLIIAELGKKNQQLQQELTETKELLAKTKLKSKATEAKIKKITDPKGFPAKELLAKVKPQEIADTIISNCDSLINDVNEYIQDNAVKDSLYELQIEQLDCSIRIKDSIISQKEYQNKKLTFLLSQSLIQQENLVKQNELLKKKIKRQKFRRKVVAIGATILSGIAADYLIRR